LQNEGENWQASKPKCKDQTGPLTNNEASGAMPIPTSAVAREPSLPTNK
jgi:hypothetical protein